MMSAYIEKLQNADTSSEDGYIAIVDECNRELLEFISKVRKTDPLMIPITFANENYLDKVQESEFIQNISNRAKMEVSCRNVLLNYDRKFELKNNYYDFLENSIELIDNEISYDDAKEIIDNLLNYKNEDELYELIKDRIEGEVIIDKNQNILIINANTSEINKYMNTQNITAVFPEVKKRYRQTGEIDTLLINIVNNDIDITKPNPIESIRYIYNINSSRVERYFKNKLDDNYRFIGEERI